MEKLTKEQIEELKKNKADKLISGETVIKISKDEQIGHSSL